MDIPLIKISGEERKLLSDFMGEDVGSEIDFNRLMPVVEKIQEIEGMSFALTPNLCTVQDFRQPIKPQVFSGTGTNIQAVYKAVIEFINWYNSQTKG